MISYASCRCGLSTEHRVERWRLRKPSFSFTSSSIEGGTSIVSSHCWDAANARYLDQGGSFSRRALFLAFVIQLQVRSGKPKGKMCFDLTTPPKACSKLSPGPFLKGIVRDARHSSSNFRCNNFRRDGAVMIFDEIEIVKIIPVLIGCHTVVKHLKYDIYSYDFCVSITLRAATSPMSICYTRPSYKPLSCHTGRRLVRPGWVNNGYTGSGGEHMTKLPG